MSLNHGFNKRNIHLGRKRNQPRSKYRNKIDLRLWKTDENPS